MSFKTAQHDGMRVVKLVLVAMVFFLAAVFDRTREFAMDAIAAQVTAPIVIIMAGADREVAATQADALVRAAGGRVVARLSIPGADHNFTAPGSARALAEAILARLPDSADAR